MSTKILDCTNVDELPKRLADAQADIDKRIGDLEWERDATRPHEAGAWTRGPLLLKQ